MGNLSIKKENRASDSMQVLLEIGLSRMPVASNREHQWDVKIDHHCHLSGELRQWGIQEAKECTIKERKKEATRLLGDSTFLQFGRFTKKKDGNIRRMTEARSKSKNNWIAGVTLPETNERWIGKPNLRTEGTSIPLASTSVATSTFVTPLRNSSITLSRSCDNLPIRTQSFSHTTAAKVQLHNCLRKTF